jgi:hypothetical protein
VEAQVGGRVNVWLEHVIAFVLESGRTLPSGQYRSHYRCWG